MLWHIAVDAVAGVAGPRYLLRSELQADDEDIHSSVGFQLLL